MSLRPLVLSLEHASGGLKLSSEAGWNQTAADWAVFIRHGTVFGMADGDTPVATAAILPYGGFGFIGMVLVTPAWRQRGLATRLLEQTISALRERALVPVLDATPAGAIVYGPLGFRTMFGLSRWERAGSPTGSAAAGAIPAPDPEDLDAVTRMDAAVFGSDRRFLFADFLGRAGTRVIRTAHGFAMTRQGHRAVQLGPVVADSEAAAIELLAATLAGVDGRVFLDVAERRSEIVRWLEANGFVRQRPFQRMALGDASGFGSHAGVMVSVGPEFG
jgi:GNAT superfamily N-acetyltransferase